MAGLRVAGLPALAPTGLALAGESEGRMGMLQVLQHCHVGSACSGVCWAQARSHANDPPWNHPEWLLECTEEDTMEPELQVLNQEQLRHSYSSPAQQGTKGPTHWAMDWDQVWAVSEVWVEARRVLGNCP